MRHFLSLAAVVLLLSASGCSDPGPADTHGLSGGATGSGRVPEWARLEMENNVGRFVADNSAYKSADEPFEAYGVEYNWMLGETGLRGHLFGLRQGEEVGPFWDFVLFWDPVREGLALNQFGGGGRIGVGWIERAGPDSSVTVQTFYAPGQEARRTGHRTTYSPGVRSDRSYSISAEGDWTEDRRYVWIRESR